MVSLSAFALLGRVRIVHSAHTQSKTRSRKTYTCCVVSTWLLLRARTEYEGGLESGSPTEYEGDEDTLLILLDRSVREDHVKTEPSGHDTYLTNLVST